MKQIWHKIWSRKWLSLFVLIVLILIGSAFLRGNKTTPPQTVTATRGNITQIVSVTGKTQPTEDVDLAFELSGRVNRTRVEVGDHVKAGQVLVELETSELAAQLQQAQATVASQQAKLDQLQKGTREEQLQITRNGVDRAKQDLLNSYADAINVSQDAYFKAEDAVRKQTDNLFTNDDQPTVQLSFTTGDSFSKLISEKDRAQLTLELADWKQSIDALAAAPTPSFDSSSGWMTENLALLAQTKKELNLSIDLLNALSDAVTKALSLSPAAIDGYKTNLNAARSSLSAALTTVTNQEQAISSSKLALDLAQRQLDLQLAGSTPEEIAAQKALVAQAQASVSGIQAQLSQAILRSPINGVVTALNTKVGQIVGPNTPAVSVISDGQMEITANIPEVDIGHIAPGEAVSITLDAYGSDKKFDGTVMSVDPGETMIEGVATYKTTIGMKPADVEVKSGMTANLDITAAQKDNVLVVPQRAVLTQNGERSVMLYKGPNQAAEKRTVEVGLRGEDGNIEIVSGLQEGDVILASPI